MIRAPQAKSTADELLVKYGDFGNLVMAGIKVGINTMPFGAPVAALLCGIYSRAAQVRRRSLFRIARRVCEPAV